MQGMIDIHSHLLYGVDDGPETLEESIRMLQEAAGQGITDIILTPHYRKGMFAYPGERILKHFLLLKKQTHDIPVRMYLGCEYHVNEAIFDYLKSGRCNTMNFTRYVLTEYKTLGEYQMIRQYTQELMQQGYIPIIAHLERYQCLTKDISLVEELSEMGALLQVNADSILGKYGWGLKKFCHRLLDEGLVDFVASDAHDCGKRANHLGKCRTHLEKKYDSAYVEQILYTNALHILDK